MCYNGSAFADTIGVRYANQVPVNLEIGEGIGQYGGKALEGVYTHDFIKGLYGEIAGGEYYKADFDASTSFIGESSLGIRVETPTVFLGISQGIVYMPNVPMMTEREYATHIELGLQDSVTGIRIAFEQSHYSNGKSTGKNNGMNMSGIVISVLIH